MVVSNPQATGKNALWGCLPGYICAPPKPDACQIYANPPSFTYLCDPNNCIPSPPYTDVQWNHTADWSSGETSYFPPSKDYYNLDPYAFGLNYGIFAEEIVSSTIVETQLGKTRTYVEIYTTGDWSSQASISMSEIITVCLHRPSLALSLCSFFCYPLSSYTVVISCFTHTFLTSC